jgi:nucleoid DNA-binding protein
VDNFCRTAVFKEIEKTSGNSGFFDVQTVNLDYHLKDWPRPRGILSGSLDLNRVKEIIRMATKKASNGNKPPTKSEVFNQIASDTGLTRKEVGAVFESLGGMINKSLSSRGPGLFNVVGLMKIKVVKKPATKERKGINPFTGEEAIFKAKPARKVVKVQPLKALKDMV